MDNLFEKYVNINNNFTREKLLEFETLRKKESAIKTYSVSLQELDREQFENGFYKFKNQFNKLISYLSDFDPDNINHEFSKIEEYKIFILRYKGEFLNISQKLSFIRNKWEKFLERNEFLKDSHLDLYFIKEYNSVWDIVESSKTSELSSTEYSISKFSEDIETIILSIEKIGIYLKQYVFIGDEAELIKNELSDNLNVSKISSKEDFVNNLEKIFNRIKDISDNSVYGTVGLKVFKASSFSSPDIFKFTIELSENNYLKYDPFLKSEGMNFEDTGLYIYFENFPKKGIFKGREICENISLDNGYLKIVNLIKNKFKFLLNLILSSGIILSIFSLFASSLTMGIGIGILLIVSYISIDLIFDFYISKLQGKYKNMFYPVKLDFGITKLGNTLEPLYLMNGLIENFDSVFNNKISGDKKWIKEYQFQKNH